MAEEQRPKGEAVVEEEKKKEKECLEYEAEDEDEEEEFPRKYVTINDLREKWLKKQQKKEKDEEMRKENFGGNGSDLGFGVNPNLIEDDGDGSRGVMVNDLTVKKAEINGKNDGWVFKKRSNRMTGPERKKRWTERRRIRLINEEAQKRALQTRVENEAEMKQIGVSVMHIAVTQDVGKFRRKKRFPGKWNVVQEKEKGAQEELFPVTGTRNTVLEKRAEVDVDVEEKGEWFPTTETRNTVKEKRVQEEKLKRSETETRKKKRFPVTRTWNTMQQEQRGHEEEEKEKLSREIEEKMKEVSILEKQYQEVEQEMKVKRNELSLLEKRFHDIEKMEETQASETDHNVSNNADHGPNRRAMGYRRLEVSGRGRHEWGRGWGRGGDGHHSERGGVVWVKKDEGLHKTN